MLCFCIFCMCAIFFYEKKEGGGAKSATDNLMKPKLLITSKEICVAILLQSNRSIDQVLDIRDIPDNKMILE